MQTQIGRIQGGTQMRYLSPFQNRQELFSDFDKLVDSFFTNNTKKWENFPEFSPKVDVKEGEGYFLISADLPGLSEKDVKVEVNDNTLSISGERNFEHKEEKEGKINRLERSYGKFSRSFILPEKIDIENIQARCEHGVLEVFVPKTKVEEKKSVKIETQKGNLFSKKIDSKTEVN
jgi:HSP20 family protein